jgi:rhodanese-related sulfurtransferase
MTKNKKPKTKFPLFLIVGVILIAVIAGAALLISAQPKALANLPTQVSVAQAAELRDSGAFVLDVREPEEWVEVRIPGSTHIPLGQLASRISEVPNDQEILVVCRSGNRSQTGRDILKQAGFENVTSMSGGVISWKNGGFPTVSGP